MQAIRFLLGVFFWATTAVAWAEEEYQPRAELVAEDVYVIVGPTTQRAKWNDGLNANYGVVLTPEGVLLIDSGASYQGAQKIEDAVQEVTDQVFWFCTLDQITGSNAFNPVWQRTGRQGLFPIFKKPGGSS